MKHLLKVLALLALLATVVLPAAAQDEMMSQTAECGAEGYTGNFQTIEAVDAQTVKFTLCTPDPAFPSKVAFSAFQIYPSEYLESTGGGGTALFEHPIGTGPYMLDTWTQGTEIVLTKNENYWGEPAIEPTVIFRWNADATARLTELQAGTADGIDNVGPGDFEVIEADPSLQLFPREGLNVFYLGFNNTIAPFDNLNVRKAIAYGIDKERIVANFYPPGSSVADQFMPSAIATGYTPEVEGFQYDPEMARQLLEESGLELPLEVTLNYRDVARSYLPQPGIVATDIQAQLAEIGINVTIEVLESGAFIDAANAGELAFHMLGWGADYPDATNFLDYHFGTGASPQFGDKFEEITGPLAEAAAVADVDERNAIYVEANTAIRDLVPMVPIAHGGSAVAYRGTIGGNPHSSPLGNESFAVVEDPDDDNFIWLQNGTPSGLYCADETDGEALRVCEQINEALLGYEIGGTNVVPVLAESYEPNEDLTEWTFTLRDGVVFHDGSTLDANDVVQSYVVQWDAANPLHVGRTGDFTYFSALFGGFLNPQPAEGE